MNYNLVYSRRAARDIGVLESAVRKRIGKKLLLYKERPLEHAEALSDSALGSYRFRIGDYRVIFDIISHDLVILRIGHRKEIYRTRR